jgi:thiosulfate dehydrogenase [quinone] large subunit
MTATIDRRTHHTFAETVLPPATESARQKAVDYTLAGLRLALGWVFLWASLDKLFGWGFATPEKNAWINGGSPTKGFLGNAASRARSLLAVVAAGDTLGLGKVCARLPLVKRLPILK